MGIGAALVMPATLSILTNVFTDPGERAKAIGVWSAVAGIAIALGPIGGGLLLAHFSWGSIFLVNIPIVAVAIGLGVRYVPTSRDPATSKLDLGGALLSMIGLGLLVWALIEAPARGWTDGLIVGAFTASLVVLTGFVRYELRVREPMLDVRFFLNARFTAANVSIMFLFFALSGFIFGVAQYLQSVQGYTALQAGVRTLPFAAGVMLLRRRLPGRRSPPGDEVGGRRRHRPVHRRAAGRGGHARGRQRLPDRVPHHVADGRRDGPGHGAGHRERDGLAARRRRRASARP